MPRTRPTPSSLAVSRQMSRMRRRDTSAETELRSVLYRRGLRYRVEYRVDGMPRRRIDIAFPGPKVAVYVDGCFWHGCPLHCVQPKSNAAWWRDKLAENRKRDEQTDFTLSELGWHVIRVWEHDAPEAAADLITAAVETRRHARPSHRRS